MNQTHQRQPSESEAESGKKSIDVTSTPPTRDDDVTRPSAYRCAVIGCLFFILFNLLAICGAVVFSYFYMAVPLAESIEATMDAVNSITIDDLAVIVEEPGRFVRAQQMPNNTVQVLLTHDPTADSVTPEEEHILLSAFNIYDANGDNMWSLSEFEVFIDDTVQPSRRFDVMDLDGDGVLSLKEIYLTMSAFDKTDIFACADSQQVLFDVFGYDTSPRDNLYYEYLAHLWMYELDQLGIDTISKANYVKYIQDEEAFYHGYNETSLVAFDEFKDRFFGSLYWESWSNSKHIDTDLMMDAYDELSAIDDVSIAELELTTQQSEIAPIIEAFMDGRSFSEATGHSPTRSLLYAFSMKDALTRRRLGQGTGDVIYECTVRSTFLRLNCELIEHSWTTRVSASGQEFRDGEDCSCNCQANGQSEWKEYMPRQKCYGSAVFTDSFDSELEHSCFDGNSVVEILVDGTVQEMQMKDVSAGDYVFDGNEYSKVIAVEKGVAKVQMTKVHLNDNSEITMTANHLLYIEKSELMQAGDLKIGDKLLNGLVVVGVEFYSYAYPVAPVTMSGKIQVNGVAASCYLFSSDFAAGIHWFLAPFRFASEYVSEYYTAKLIEAIAFDTARATRLSAGTIGANFGLPPFINAFVIVLSYPVFCVKQFFVFCFSQYSVMAFGHLMSQYISV